MELKNYQEKTLKQVKQFLELMSKEKTEGNLKHTSLDAWIELQKTVKLKDYIERQDGIGRDLPNFCLKIPTGGGKTFLAVKSIDIINTTYLKKKNGLILWVVPTNQIYQQTIKNLRNRDHSYRQYLDIASGGKTLILERSDKFSPQDIEENLVVLMLMLPAAWRENRETLRMFRDSGGFIEFFPEDDDRLGHEKLLEMVPNLETFSEKDGFWGKQIKTSLGNTLSLLKPIIILDEGQKAYSDKAQKVLKDFNPSLILELSATPKPESNILVDIKGIELSREEMIKLDLHVINKTNPEWKNTLLASREKRDLLEKIARDYESNTNIYIRPICLIQAERTGKDQRDGQHIHSEDVREYLIKTIGVPSEQVAVTSAELKELEGWDLLSRDCPIRYIITKQALQEGWDCPFAYVLSILTNPGSANALTQLVGRILRQPYARKTNIKELDESYVFSFQQNANSLLNSIKSGLEDEELGDLTQRIIADEGLQDEGITGGEEKTFEAREKFRKVAGEIIFPVFAVKENNIWRPVNYEADVLSKIPWDKVNIEYFNKLKLAERIIDDVESLLNYTDDEKSKIGEKKNIKYKGSELEIDEVFFTRHLIDVVPNPWVAHEFGLKILEKLRKRYSKEIIFGNFVYIIEETRKHLEKEKDRLAQEVFGNLIKKGDLRFLVISKKIGYQLPKKIKVNPTSRTMLGSSNMQLQKSLFDFVPQEDINEDERKVALYLDDQERLFFWYRNQSRHDYAIQGWQKHKIYPDFLFTTDEDKKERKVFVVETKGIQLKNEDTQYKEKVFDICNKNATGRFAGDMKLETKEYPIKYQVVFTDVWRQKLEEMMNR